MSHSWSELFFDLIFVTAVAKIGEGLKEGDMPVSVYLLYLLTVSALCAIVRIVGDAQSGSLAGVRVLADLDQLWDSIPLGRFDAKNRL